MFTLVWYAENISKVFFKILIKNYLFMNFASEIENSFNFRKRTSIFSKVFRKIRPLRIRKSSPLPGSILTVSGQVLLFKKLHKL